MVWVILIGGFLILISAIDDATSGHSSRINELEDRLEELEARQEKKVDDSGDFDYDEWRRWMDETPVNNIKPLSPSAQRYAAARAQRRRVDYIELTDQIEE